ncbi:MAG: DUF2207 domain-containing protein [Mollicutes bacterium]|nr:DUF2207 domain-containing protein [Mollicutes bacterium]
MKYRKHVFEYLDVMWYTTSSGSKKSKQEIIITGRKDKKRHFLWLILCFFAITISQVDSFFLNIYILVFLTPSFEIDLNIKANLILILLIIFLLLLINLVLIILPIITVLFKRRFLYKKMEPKSTKVNIYSRELPSKLRPAHVRCLLHDGKIDGVSLGSTIIDLVDRGYLEYIKNKDNKDKLIFFHEDIKLRVTNKSQDDLLKYEKFIIEWFIFGYGNGTEVSAKEVNNGLKKRLSKYNLDSAHIFLEWQALVLMSFPIDKYYKKLDQTKYSRHLIYEILGIITIFTKIGAALFMYGSGMRLLSNPKRALNQEGVDEIYSWLTLKKFLKDFSDMENKTAEMVKIWDFYLTYSIALDISEVASKEIETFFGDNIYTGTLSRAMFVSNTTPQSGNLYDEKQIKTFEVLQKEIEEEYKKL